MKWSRPMRTDRTPGGKAKLANFTKPAGRGCPLLVRPHAKAGRHDPGAPAAAAVMTGV
jgi:hypothetical protein